MSSKRLKWLGYHLFVGIFAIVMLYPVIWLVMSSFKPSNLIFVTAGNLHPRPLDMDEFRTRLGRYCRTIVRNFYQKFVDSRHLVDSRCRSIFGDRRFRLCAQRLYRQKPMVHDHDADVNASFRSRDDSAIHFVLGAWLAQFVRTDYRAAVFRRSFLYLLDGAVHSHDPAGA